MKRPTTLLPIYARLLSRREALRAALESQQWTLSKPADGVGDAGDEALDAEVNAINSQLIESESTELACIETAIDRFREGLYGLCETCARKIPLARLQVLPYATRCIRCQRAAEQNVAPPALTGDSATDFDDSFATHHAA